MWVHFIDYMFAKGGFLGIVAVTEAFVIVWLAKRFLEKVDAIEKTHKDQQERCRVHQQELKAEREHAASECHTMIRGFYDDTRNDMRGMRQETMQVFERVIDSNDEVSNGLNSVNNTLSSITGRLNGRP